MKKKVYTSAPLPFMGQKRRFLKQFKQALSTFEEATIFVDLFGGSGLLSYTTKQVRPDAVVVYNDFDDYHLRLINVRLTNIILDHIREMVKGCKEDKKLSDTVKSSIINYLSEQEEKHGFIDYITLSSSLLFSMNYATSLAELRKQSMYNCVRKSNYPEATSYLDGLFIVKNDYKELFEKYRNQSGVVFIVDPPYLSTEQCTYQNYWRLADYLDVLKVLKDNSYVYFTSDKSSILELCEWLETNLAAINPFRDSTREEMRVNVNHSAGYTDMMLYKVVDVAGEVPEWESDIVL